MRKFHSYGPVFVPTEDEIVIVKLCFEKEIDKIKVNVAAIGWA